MSPMYENILFCPDAPGLHVVAVDQPLLAEWILTWTDLYPDWAIRRIRGRKSQDDAQFFDEAGAALQFPYYFGENWDAFWDCIIDLTWLRAASFLVIIDRVDFLLKDSDRSFSTLMKILDAANGYWRGQSGYFGSEVRPVAFQTLLACSEDILASTLPRIEKAGVFFSQL